MSYDALDFLITLALIIILLWVSFSLALGLRLLGVAAGAAWDRLLGRLGR
jgi:hypothetical protein